MVTEDLGVKKEIIWCKKQECGKMQSYKFIVLIVSP